MTKRSKWGAAAGAAAVAALVLGLASSAWAQTGAIVGAVTSAATGLPVTSGTVTVCITASTGACTTLALNATGTYASMVPAGTYVAFTTNTPLVEEIFGGITCPVACNSDSARALGTSFVVGSGQTVTRNFALRQNGTVTGRVLDASTRAPIASRVRLFVRFGSQIGTVGTSTDATGAFTISNLGPGTFHAFTEQATVARAYVNQIYRDIPCVGSCSTETAVTSGTPIVVTAGAVTAGIDFLLAPAARITGTVRDATTSAVLQDAFVGAYVRVGHALERAAIARTSAAGTYTLDGLAAGSYVVTTARLEHVDEVHANRPCAADCRLDEIARGDAVTLAAGGAATVDVALDTGGSISGSVTEAGSGTPLDATVVLFRTVGSTISMAGRVDTDAAGLFTVRGLATGAYVVLALAESYPSELFGGVHCLPCLSEAVATGVPVPVTSGANTPGVHIAMDRGGAISGTVTTTPGNAAAENVSPRLFRRSGPPGPLMSRTSDSLGQYSFTDLPPGTYVVATSAERLRNEVYDNVACPGVLCSPAFAAANGVGIQVGAGATVPGIDFSLGAATGPPELPGTPVAVNVPGGVQFTWTAAELGGVATSYLLDAGLAPGTTLATLPVAGTSLFVPGVPPGTYFIRVRGVNGAGAGAASDELTLRVGAGGIVAPGEPISVATFISAGRLTMTWQPPFRGPVPTSYLLEVGTATGLSNIAVVPVVGHLFQFDGVPPGYYFVRVRGVVAGAVGPPTRDVVMVAGNAPAPPGEPLDLSSNQTSNTVTITWQPPVFGPVTSYILEAGTAPGLANITTINVGNTTSLTVPGVPRGTYHLRVRAVNALGSSPPSSDLTLVVP